MSGYTVEEPEEIKYFVDEEKEIIEYWSLYSKMQKSRNKKVLNQLMDVWKDVYGVVNMMRMGGLSLDESNEFMERIHKIFFIQHNYKIDYFSEDKIRLRKNKNYKNKKLFKIRILKSKL